MRFLLESQNQFLGFYKELEERLKTMGKKDNAKIPI